MSLSVVEGPDPRPPRCWPPQTEWLAEYNQRSPYNEAEIVRLIKEIFDLLILFGFVEAEKIDWAPANGHSINEMLCKEFGLETPVISLIQKLPYIKHNPYGQGDSDFYFFPDSPQIRYLNDDLFRKSRLSESFRDTANAVEAQDLLITDSLMYGTSIILDTRENVIRLVSPQSAEDIQYPLQKLELEKHYRNVFGRHAPSFLQRHIDRIRSLSLIPIHSKGAGSSQLDYCDESIHEYLNPRIGKILKEDFGYPDNFRHREWIAAHETVWNDNMEEICEEYGDF